MYLAEHDVVAEITTTERAAMFRFTFPENEHSYIVVDAFDKGSSVRVIPEENKILLILLIMKLLMTEIYLILM